jgi:acetyl esterase/lipase
MLLALAFGLVTNAAPQSATTIQGADGGTIHADLYGSSERGIVLAHGGRFDRTSWKPQALVLAAAGFRVIAIDFRAAVEARAGRETPCLYDAHCLAKDVVAAVRYLNSSGAKTVSIVGASLGGGAAAQATIDAPADNIDRVVLLAHMLIDTPEKIRGRKLFIVARDDRGGNNQPRLEGIRGQYDRAPGPKELIVLDGSAHAQFLFETGESQRLMREIVRFLTAP